MTHRHIEAITFGTCLVICAGAHTHVHAHILTRARALWGCPPFKRWLGGGGRLCFCHTFFRWGLRTTLGGGGGGGLNSEVWEGVLFFVSQVVIYWFLWIFT